MYITAYVVTSNHSLKLIKHQYKYKIKIQYVIVNNELVIIEIQELEWQS